MRIKYKTLPTIETEATVDKVLIIVHGREYRISVGIHGNLVVNKFDLSDNADATSVITIKPSSSNEIRIK